MVRIYIGASAYKHTHGLWSRAGIPSPANATWKRINISGLDYSYSLLTELTSTNYLHCHCQETELTCFNNVN